MRIKAKITTLMVLTAAAVLSLGLVAATWADPWGGGGGCGMGMHMGIGKALASLTPEQAGKLFDLKEKLRTETAPLRKQMWVKRVELAGLWKAENPDQAAIQAKQKEINDLRGQLQEKRTAFRFEAKKIAPNLPFGHGMGHGMGHGCGMMGGPGGGPGPGGPAKKGL